MENDVSSSITSFGCSHKSIVLDLGSKIKIYKMPYKIRNKLEAQLNWKKYDNHLLN